MSTAASETRRSRRRSGEARPSFFIVGAPKCGTTALYTYLKRHPDVFLTEMREPMFFGSDLYCRPRRRLTLDRYLALFADVRGERHVGECSTRYLFSKRAPEEIHRFDPGAKIIVMLRDPVEMMHSLHSQLLYSGEEEIEDFEAALAAEGERRALIDSSEPPPIPQVLLYRDMARYSEHLERYLSVFKRENVHVIIFEEFVRDLPGSYRRVLEFLGADPNFTPNFEVVNQHKAVRSKRVHERLVRAIFAPPPLALQMLPRRFWLASLKTVMKLNTHGKKRPEVPARLRRELELDLAYDIERLEMLLGRDLSCWPSRPARRT